MKRLFSVLLMLSLSVSLAGLSGCKRSKVKSKTDVTVKTKTLQPRLKAPSENYTLEKHEDHTVRVYKKPIAVNIVDYSAWDPSTPESSYAGYYSASQKLDPDWLVEVYTPEDRAVAKQKAADDRAMMQAAKENQQTKALRILQRLDYRDYVILKIEREMKDGETREHYAVLQKTQEGWLLTDALENDPFFQALEVKDAGLPVMELPEAPVN